MKKRTSKKEQIFSGLMALSFLASACTGQIQGSLRFNQQDLQFSAVININTKVDLLWVGDNSASMDSVQARLRAGMAGFAQTYLSPTWDIQLAVITTDGSPHTAHSITT